MSFKNDLKSNQAQAVAEYLIVFMVLTAAIVAVFWCLNPDGLSVKSSFDDSISSTISQIGR